MPPPRQAAGSGLGGAADTEAAPKRTSSPRHLPSPTASVLGRHLAPILPASQRISGSIVLPGMLQSPPNSPLICTYSTGPLGTRTGVQDSESAVRTSPGQHRRLEEARLPISSFSSFFSSRNHPHRPPPPSGPGILLYSSWAGHSPGFMLSPYPPPHRIYRAS